MPIIETLAIHHWQEQFSAELQKQAVNALESGLMLFLPNLSFDLSTQEQRFLSPVFVDRKSKNISYDPSTDSIKGIQGTQQEHEEIKAMLQRFFAAALALTNNLLPFYQNKIQLGRTSFRPVQVSNRKTSYRKDDRRLHVDAFPANPNQGQRILRVFSNINPQGEDRVWQIGEPFVEVAKRFLPEIGRPFPGSSFLLEKLRLTKSRRTEYDHIMLQLHDRMKKDSNYQHKVNKTELRLPPNSSWIVQTDEVSHAALSGQHILEQTFYVPVAAMVNPNLSPLKILERLLQRRLN